MKPATVSPLDFTFRTYTHMLGGWHILVFYNQVCMEHILVTHGRKHDALHEYDLTDLSKFPGRFEADVMMSYPHFKPDLWEATILFLERENDFNLYLAGRREYAINSDLSEANAKHILWAITQKAK